MRDQLEYFYEQELYAIRKLAVDFARDRPKIASRLDLDLESGSSSDPHVERMIESFAFLTARIRLKLEDEFPELTDALLSVIYPHYLAPVPSTAIVQLHPDPEQGQLTDGYEVPRHSKLLSRSINDVNCQFRTAYPVTLWPLEIAAAQYMVAPFGEAIKLPSRMQGTEALIRLELRATGGTSFAELPLDQLRFFLAADDRTVHQLYEMLMKDVTRVLVRQLPAGPSTPPLVLPPDSLQPVGFGRDEGLLPYPNQSFVGYRLLTEYFTFPQKFLFVDLKGLERARSEDAGDRLEVLLLFEQADRTLEGRVSKSTFRLGCTPAVNLFQQQADPIDLAHVRTEYRVVPDRRHWKAMEVYSVDAVESLNIQTGESVEYQPFFSFRHGSLARRQDAYWYAHRRPSVRAGDAGTEMFLSLVDLNFNPRLPPVEKLIVRATCTNRDLAGELRTISGNLWHTLEGAGLVRRIDTVVMPTAPLRLPFGTGRWRLISHLSLNHLSITDDESGADALREILKLYDYANSRVTAQQISGVVGVKSRRKTARITDGTRSAFCRGVEITVELDPEKYVGSGMYLFASVLDRFLGMYTSLNSFTRFVTTTAGSAEPFKIWPHRTGEQTLV